MKGKKRSFRVGRVRADLRGKVWYTDRVVKLRFFELVGDGRIVEQ